MTNLARLITEPAEPSRPAIRLDDFVMSYEALAGASAHVAGLLAERGVGPGDRVGLQLPNVPPFAVLFFGILRLGAVVVPLNPLLKEREVVFHLSDSGAKVLFAWHGFGAAARAGAEAAGADYVEVEPESFVGLVGSAKPRLEVAERAGDDTAVIIYTSGTTGTPKGAELTHGSWLDAAEVAVELAGSGPESVILGSLPLFHAFGLGSGLLASMCAGASITLLPRFDAGKVLEMIQRDRVDILLGVPTMYNALLHHPERDAFDTSSLRICVSGGAAMPVEVLRGFEEAFDCKVLEGYGLSETCAMATFNRPDRERKPGSIGLPVAGVEIRLVDAQDDDVPAGEVGALVIRRPHVMKGYFGHDDATAEAMRGGWLHTGDMATVDDDGYFFIVDRKKDMIIRGGYNVYPREIEEVLYEHPAVSEAAVVGVPDPSMGEEVGAAVVLKPGVG